MHRRASLVALIALLHAGAGCGTDKQPLKCQNDDACPADATCQVGLCTALPAGECRLPAACSPPANATATCDANHACGFTCNDNHHLCSDACILESPDSCGASCKKCDVPTNGIATCTNGECGMECGDGQHLCSYACIAESKDSCGPYCTKCPTTEGGVAVCRNSQCEIACGDGFSTCPGPNGTTRCILGSCPACDSDHVVCASGCCSRITQLSAGSGHSCAVTATTAVQCWGANTGGQLGNSSVSLNTYTPVDVLDQDGSPLTGVAHVLAGQGAYSCALMLNGTVKCWGDNGSGQLGNPINYRTTVRNYIPSDVIDDQGAPLSGVTQLADGGDHVCALTTSGSVKCWGRNFYGQLGNNSTTNAPMALSVWADKEGGTLTRVLSIAAGDKHTCALTDAHSLKCWGLGYGGRLGTGDETTSLVPVDVRSSTGGILDGVADVAAGSDHTCALMTIGSVKCWGFNTHGQLGSIVASPLLPVDVPSVSAATSISASSGYTCVVEGGFNSVQCWGQNDSYQAGCGPAELSTPTVLRNAFGTDLINVQELSTGPSHACVLTTSSLPLCWGSNVVGELGTIPRGNQCAPTAVIFQH